MLGIAEADGAALAVAVAVAVAPANAMPPNTMTRSRRSSFTEARLPTIGCVSPVEIAVSGCSHAEARA